MIPRTMEQISTAAVWAQFSGRLRGYIGRRVREESDVEDVLQDVFSKIHRGLGRLKEVRNLEAWLFRIARRGVLDHLRSRSGKRRTSKLPEEIAEKRVPANVSAEVAAWMRPLMALLPKADRQALRLSDLAGLSQKDLASRLGLSRTAAKSRVQRARRRLQEVLLECCLIERDLRGNLIGYRRRKGSCGACSCSPT
jgi:RNA polymerase sigma-70 factor (ECF subfamily)